MNEFPGQHEMVASTIWSPTPSTRAVRLVKPPGFSFQTSQAVRLFASGPGGDTARPMSIASSTERDHLDFVARWSDSDFKRAFFAMRPGDRVRLWGPRGHFLLDWDRPAVLLAGGIGITPFRSMLQTMVDRNSGPPTFLAYANRSPGDVPFKTELDELAARSININILYTVSHVGPDESWAHRIGRIDASLLREVTAGLPGAVFYLAGPVGFVRSLAAALLEIEVDPGEVRVEVFRGYADDPTAPGTEERSAT
ncbi:MAG: FAD-dependent oxidoreductase [Verrucomicrobiales bacterium]|nr:FAD-dependent oxidoreductase [Verrucomicrobiales bacterium]